MTTTVTVHAAKTHLSRLIEQALRGEEVVIARGDKPVVRLVPVDAPQPKRQFGSLRRRTRGPRQLPRPAARGRAEALGRRLNLACGSCSAPARDSVECSVSVGARVARPARAFLWWLAGYLRLPVAARTAFDAPGGRRPRQRRLAARDRDQAPPRKLPLKRAVAADPAGTVAAYGFAHLPLDARSAEIAGHLLSPHATRSTAFSSPRRPGRSWPRSAAAPTRCSTCSDDAKSCTRAAIPSSARRNR